SERGISRMPAWCAEMSTERSGARAARELPPATARSQRAADGAGNDADDFFVRRPEVSLPRGGGAIRGLGETFSTNPVTGSGALAIPVAVSPGRGGFSPQPTLSYDSAAGNGPFGWGWSLGLAAITRKTEKGLPQYRDDEDSDVFLLSGTDDLVP